MKHAQIAGLDDKGNPIGWFNRESDYHYAGHGAAEGQSAQSAGECRRILVADHSAVKTVGLAECLIGAAVVIF